MELRLTYQEITDFIEKKSGRALPVVYGGPHTVRVSYEVDVLFKTASVGLDITVEGIEGSAIILSYNGGAGIDFMIRQAIATAQKRPGGEMIEMLDGNRIRLSLGGIQQAEAIFDRIELRDIRFDEQYAIVEFVPKAL